ncbi:MAG: DUF1015 domain-containing protein [Candidatus Hydrogenedentes bacterium]|nr:DUF1015 domain-containing protein [Candidatus Hydrogenedentota bacterium]
MAEVRGFSAYRFDPAVVGNLDDVVTPPFDVITEDERVMLSARSPYNYTHVILPQDGNGKSKYDVAAGLLGKWIAEGALKQDNEESFYLLEQTFTALDGATCIRRGFFGVAKVPEPGEDTVLGHERTFEWKVTDRLALTEATKTNLGAVFVLYKDDNHELGPFLNQMNLRAPDLEARTFEGVTQKVWRVKADPAVTAFFKDKKLYIADGHHRYRTAHTYRDKMRLQEHPEGPRPYNYVLMGFIAMYDEGLFVYPAHRVIDLPQGFNEQKFLKDLEPWFEVLPVDSDLAEHVREEEECAIGLALRGGKRFVLRLRDIERVKLLGDQHGPAWRDLDVSVLHGGILERLLHFAPDAVHIYEKDPAIAIDMVESGKKGAAFILRNMQPSQVCACAEARESMPQKATYFFPKLPSGAAIYVHEAPAAT